MIDWSDVSGFGWWLFILYFPLLSERFDEIYMAVICLLMKWRLHSELKMNEKAHDMSDWLWVRGKHFTVTIIKLLNVILRIPIIHLLPIYFCTNSWNVRSSICLEGRLSLLALSSVYSLTVEDGSWSTGAGTVVCPFTTSRGIDTETCEMDNVFPPDDL